VRAPKPAARRLRSFVQATLGGAVIALAIAAYAVNPVRPLGGSAFTALIVFLLLGVAILGAAILALAYNWAGWTPAS
jgi:hypothetical protein